MSSAFRLRQKLKEQKASAKEPVSTGRVDSPFAKYVHGELKCIVCDSIVRSEKAWPVHINSKKHKENIALAKEMKEKLVKTGINPLLSGRNQPPSVPIPNKSFKRPGTPPPIIVSGQTKKLKGILKNSNKPKDEDEDDAMETNDNPVSLINKDLININRNGKDSDSKLPAEETIKPNELPDGFFDNPKEDAKAHHREFKDPNDEEWDRFQKEIKDAETVSTQIINEEQEESTTERQIVEIDEQMRIWSKVLDLEKKREKVVDQVKSKSVPMDEDRDEPMKSDDSDDDEEEVDIDEYLDWRAKKSHK